MCVAQYMSLLKERQSQQTEAINILFLRSKELHGGQYT